MDFESLQRSAQQIAGQQLGVVVSAYLTCRLYTTQGLVSVDLSTSWDFAKAASGSTPSSFQTAGVHDWYHQASLYWAYSALVMYWVQLTNAMYVANQNSAFHFYKGYVDLSRKEPAPSSTSDIESLDFFRADCFFIPFSEDGYVPHVSCCEGGPDTSVSQLSTAEDGSSNSPLPGIWVPADSMAKALYYAVLVDLGQDPTVTRNMFADPQLLTSYTSNFSNIMRTNTPTSFPGQNAAPAQAGFATEAYTIANQSLPHNLTIYPSTLAAEYICQIPKLKPRGTLVFAVLIADLVLLQTIWKVYKLVIDYFLVRKHPELMLCRGCAARRAEPDDDLPLVACTKRSPDPQVYSAVPQEGENT